MHVVRTCKRVCVLAVRARARMNAVDMSYRAASALLRKIRLNSLTRIIRLVQVLERDMPVELLLV